MRKKTHTKEERSKYFAGLRSRWSNNKALADQDQPARVRFDAIQAEAEAQGARVSFYGYYFTLKEMQSQGLDGDPYIDAKTFQGWKLAGFQVKRGEHSLIKGITWITAGTGAEKSAGTDQPARSVALDQPEGDQDGGGRLYPKEYSLFHRSQVEPIAEPVAGQ